MSQPQADRISVVIVEDTPISRAALQGYVEMRADRFELLGMADNRTDACRLVEELVPDIVLLDLAVPPVANRTPSTEEGLAAIEAIRDVSPQTQIVVLTGYFDDEHVFAAFRKRATAYLTKNSVGGPDLPTIIEQVHAGEPPVDPFIARRIIQYFRTATPPDVPNATLTQREQPVLALIVQGKSNKEIADELVIGIKTVKTHVSNILAKLHLRNRTELRRYGLGQSPPPPDRPRDAPRT